MIRRANGFRSFMVYQAAHEADSYFMSELERHKRRMRLSVVEFVSGVIDSAVDYGLTLDGNTVY